MGNGGSGSFNMNISDRDFRGNSFSDNGGVEGLGRNSSETDNQYATMALTTPAPRLELKAKRKLSLSSNSNKGLGASLLKKIVSIAKIGKLPSSSSFNISSVGSFAGMDWGENNTSSVTGIGGLLPGMFDEDFIPGLIENASHIENHVIVFGCVDNIALFLNELRRPLIVGSSFHPIVVVHEKEPPGWKNLAVKFREVYFIKGNISHGKGTVS